MSLFNPSKIVSDSDMYSCSLLRDQNRAVFLFPGKDQRVMVVEFPVDDAFSPWPQALKTSATQSGITLYQSPDHLRALRKLVGQKTSANKAGGPWPLSNVGLLSGTRSGSPTQSDVEPGSQSERLLELTSGEEVVKRAANTYLLPDTDVSYDGATSRRSLVEAHSNVFIAAPYVEGRGAIATTRSGYSRGCAFVSRLEYWDGVHFNDPFAGAFLPDTPFGQPLVEVRSLLRFLVAYTAAHLREFNTQIAWAVMNMTRTAGDSPIASERLQTVLENCPCLTAAEYVAYQTIDATLNSPVRG